MRADFGKGGEQFAGPGEPELAIKRRESISGTARCFRAGRPSPMLAGCGTVARFPL